MATSFTREDYDKIKMNLPAVIEGKDGMVQGANACLEIAQESQAPVYIKSGEALVSAVNKVAKAAEEAIEITEKVMKKYEALIDAGLLA